eukprot:scaffold1031_cov461-Prasinococcus_capsulatus_cf.AAC.8
MCEAHTHARRHARREASWPKGGRPPSAAWPSPPHLTSPHLTSPHLSRSLRACVRASSALLCAALLCFPPPPRARASSSRAAVAWRRHWAATPSRAWRGRPCAPIAVGRCKARYKCPAVAAMGGQWWQRASRVPRTTRPPVPAAKMRAWSTVGARLVLLLAVALARDSPLLLPPDDDGSGGPAAAAALLRPLPAGRGAGGLVLATAHKTSAAASSSKTEPQDSAESKIRDARQSLLELARRYKQVGSTLGATRGCMKSCTRTARRFDSPGHRVLR